MMPVELGYVTIPVPSVPQAKIFFEALFDWKFEQVSGPGSAHIGNTRLPFGFSTGGPVNYSTLYFKVADIQAMIEKVTALGGSAREIEKNPSGLTASCTDDQKTAFSLWQPAPGFAT